MAKQWLYSKHHALPLCGTPTFACTGPDGTLAAWSVSTLALEAQAKAAAAAHDEAGGRWAAVLDNAELLEQLRDFFYYAQIRAQGEDTMEPRNIPGVCVGGMQADKHALVLELGLGAMGRIRWNHSRCGGG